MMPKHYLPSCKECIKVKKCLEFITTSICNGVLLYKAIHEISNSIIFVVWKSQYKGNVVLKQKHSWDEPITVFIGV